MKTLEQMIETMQAAREGKVIQVKSHLEPEWRDLLNAGGRIDPWWDWKDSDYRVKPPELKRVPLGVADIELHRDLFRHKEEHGVASTAHSVHAAGIWIAGGTLAATWDDLREQWDRSIDGGATWQGCWKEEV